MAGCPTTAHYNDFKFASDDYFQFAYYYYLYLIIIIGQDFISIIIIIGPFHYPISQRPGT